jgi:SAM-dependent methyltransferase
MQTIVCNDLKVIYNKVFFAEQIDGSARSARIVVPVIMELVRDVSSVVDLGCGAGAWLAQFKEVGVQRVLGLDGGTAAEHDQLEIEPHEFRLADLEREIHLDETFDLCICLEVAEHLAHRAAPVIVQNACKLSDVILFSAAIPGQGGTHHINERWPTYWVDLFASAGYEALDVVRGRLWNDARVEWWYRQNLILFANRAGLARIVRGEGESSPLDIVHPVCFEHYRRKALERDSSESGRSADLERRNADLQDQIQSILNSTSWKLTWPLRRLIGDNDSRRRKLRALARMGWLIASAKFLRRREHID